jgi:hypothetical protein
MSLGYNGICLRTLGLAHGESQAFPKSAQAACDGCLRISRRIAQAVASDRPGENPHKRARPAKRRGIRCPRIQSGSWGQSPAWVYGPTGGKRHPSGTADGRNRRPSMRPLFFCLGPTKDPHISHMPYGVVSGLIRHIGYPAHPIWGRIPCA